jgi:hypothetical protein
MALILMVNGQILPFLEGSLDLPQSINDRNSMSFEIDASNITGYDIYDAMSSIDATGWVNDYNADISVDDGIKFSVINGAEYGANVHLPITENMLLATKIEFWKKVDNYNYFGSNSDIELQTNATNFYYKALTAADNSWVKHEYVKADFLPHNSPDWSDFTNLAIYIENNGGASSLHLKWFRYYVPNGSTSIETGSRVELIDDSTGQLLFAGFVHDYNKENPTWVNGQHRYKVECVDNNSIADRHLCAESFISKTAAQIATILVTNYLSQDGVTLGTCPDTAIFTKIISNYRYVSDVLNTIRDTAQLNWTINNEGILNLFFREDYFGGYLTDADIMDIKESGNKKDYRNSQVIIAGYDTTVTQSETPTPKGDGSSKQFFVRYPIAEKPTIIQQGTTVSGTSVGINGLDTNKWWYWSKGDKSVYQDNSQGALLSTQSLSVSYKGLVKVIVACQDSAGIEYMRSLEGGSGIYENVESQPNMDSRAAATEYANGLLVKYGSLEKVVEVKSQTKFQVGSIVSIVSSKLGINDNFLLESASLSYEVGEFWYSYKFLSGESKGSWVEFFRKLRLSAEGFDVSGDETLVHNVSQNEAVQEYCITSISVTNQMFPSNSLYPSDSLYPNLAKILEVDFQD